MARRSSGRFGRSPFCSTASVVSVAFASLVLLLVPAVTHADTLSGRVLDPSSQGVAGATVLILEGQRVVTTTRTQDDGRFGPLRLAPGTYEVVASAPGLRSPRLDARVAAGADISITVPLALTAIEDSVVVSVSQVETTLSRATDSVTVIERRDLQRQQAENVVAALRAVPGFGVAASGGRGALTSIFPRGGESDYTLVLVNGIPQNAFGGGYDASHLGTSDVERIEVVRGPESALYGGGAIGGVLQVVTRQGGAPAVDAIFEAGGNGTRRGKPRRRDRRERGSGAARSIG